MVNDLLFGLLFRRLGVGPVVPHGHVSVARSGGRPRHDPKTLGNRTLLSEGVISRDPRSRLQSVRDGRFSRGRGGGRASEGLGRLSDSLGGVRS